MSTTTIPSVPETQDSPPGRGGAFENAVVLSQIDWEEYVLLRDKPGNPGLRMTFDDGVLEIMTLSSFHELISMLIHTFIHEWRMARNIQIRSSGSMTLRCKSINRGLEGDQSYYIQNEPRVRALNKIDLETAPPPDLAIEVEHRAAAIRKMPIYARLGVPEVWRWHDEMLTIHRLVDGEYVEQEDSTALPGFPFKQLRTALSQRSKVDETTLMRQFRQSLESCPGD
ncbi:MAG: Uma2 family endonuclease [Planctomycetaceae bacterium]